VSMAALSRAEKDFAQGRRGRVLHHPIKTARIKAASLKPHWVVADVFWGASMKVILPECVSASVYRSGVFEPCLTKFLVRSLEEGAVFFDVGAHIGYFSLLAKHLGAEVHAFEPTKSSSLLLQENVKSLRLNRVALSDHGGELELTDFGPLYGAFNSINPRERDLRRFPFERYLVPTTTLDSYVRETGAQPDVIKIDVEGAEEVVVAGAAETLEQCRPVITAEVGYKESNGLIELMKDLNYSPFEIADGELVEFRHRDLFSYDNLAFIHASMARVAP
jgi:FkbM family methyltransferase